MLENLHADVAVIGSGPGGAVTACMLAENGVKVVLLEEGQDWTGEEVRPFSVEELQKKYRNGGISVTWGRPRVAYAEGSCLGGGSEVNSALCHRMAPEILEQWSKDFGLAGLEATRMEEHFQACEADLSVSALSGTPPPASCKLVEGAEKLGWKVVEAARFMKVVPDGGRFVEQKQSMSVTYLPRARAAGCRIITSARVHRLRDDGDWHIECHFKQNGRVAPGRVRARHVFVCCGAIGTPSLLRRSGIGHRVGETLQMHPMLKAVAEFPEEVNGPGMGVPMHQVKEYAPTRSLGCSVSSRPFLALGLANYPEARGRIKDDWKRMAVYYAATCGGWGVVRNLPGFRDPFVTYRLDEHDLYQMRQGLDELCRCLFSAGATAVYPAIQGRPPLRGFSELKNLPARLPPGCYEPTTVHVFSSCRMAHDPRLGTVNAFGAVHGAARLYVGDASLLPSPPGVNPQGIIMALARRNALHFLESCRAAR